jgi:phage-related protein
LFEWRIVDGDDARIVFFHGGQRRLVIVHLFVKKSQKLPKRQRDTALRRMKRWQERQEP